MPPGRRRPRGLTRDRARFASVGRLAVQESANGVLPARLQLPRVFGLRAEEVRVFGLVALATAQRHVRGATAASQRVDKSPREPAETGAVSRRRISETLGIPLETVRRHVARLIARGLVIERGRGRIATPGGTLARVGADGTTLQITRGQLALANALLRPGVFVDARRRGRGGRIRRRPGTGHPARPRRRIAPPAAAPAAVCPQIAGQGGPTRGRHYATLASRGAT